MKRKIWVYMSVICLWIAMLVAGSRSVSAIGNTECGSCPVGTSCQEVGPDIWVCEAGVPGPGPTTPPPNDDPCGETAAPSCGGWCDNGSSCVTTSSNPSCHCKANANGAPQCTGTKVVKSYAPIGTLNNNACQFAGDCWSYFPSIHTVTGCDGKDVKGRCKVSYLCCNSNQVISCTTGSNDTHEITGTICPAGEMKASARTSFYFTQDDPPERITNYFVTCRRNCGCINTCDATAPTGLAISQGSSESVAVMNWSPGTGGASQKVYVDEDLAEVNADCPTAGDCELNQT